MEQKRKDPYEPIINKRKWITTAVYGLVIAVIVTGVYPTTLFYFDQSKETANTVAFFILAFSQLLHGFNMREREEHIFKNQVTRNR